MLYNEDFSMHHYVGFLQIGSHLCMFVTSKCFLVPITMAFSMQIYYSRLSIRKSGQIRLNLLTDKLAYIVDYVHYLEI